MEELKVLQSKLKAQLPDLELREQEPMRLHTTFRVGGPASLMALPRREADLGQLLRMAFQAGVTPFFLGKGSNLLVADEGVDRFLIKLAGGLNRPERAEGTAIYVGSGVTLAQAAVERYVSEELGGLEHETARFRYLFRRLLKSVYAVVDNVAEELRASQFQPISFELGFGAGKDLPPVELSVDGMTVSISGFVDRVDGWEHDGRLYLRVVDYKTGRKTFDLTDIWNGMGLQMLLDLFTLEREGEALYNREIIPAGVLYLPARDAVVAGSRAMSEAERRRKVDAELRRRGIVLDEPEVLAAMEEPGEAGIRFLPVKVNKAGAITGEALVSAERLGKLARHTGRILEEIGRELAAGNIAADPFWRGPDHNACQWCEYAAACHFEEGRGGDRRRFLPAVRGEEFWQAVAKEQV